MSTYFILCLALILPTAALTQTASVERPAISGISHLVLFADDFPKSEVFYGTLLGWDQVPSTGTASGVRFYANHSQYVELLTPPERGLSDRLDAVAFSTSDADA